MNPTIALDTVLLPPPEVRDLAVRLNRSLAGPGSEEIRLGKEDFLPHITLGKGTLDAKAGETSFTASRLALCHLGNHCTCRKVLGEWGVE